MVESDPNPIGTSVVAPALERFGTTEQKERYLSPLHKAEEIWCQLLSEPGAGSDLGSLACRAERDGDCYRLSGQKVWVTLAHAADLGLVFARTDPGLPKHKGISAFIMAMNAPGVTVVPLRELTGDAEFDEVFLDEVAVPASDLIGSEGDGWRILMELLAGERLHIAGRDGVGRGTGPIATARQLWSESGNDDPVQRDRLAQLHIESEVLGFTIERISAGIEAELDPPPPAMAKVLATEHMNRVYTFCVDLLGPAGMLYPGNYAMRVPEVLEFGDNDVRWWFLESLGRTIGGGTSEVIRNTLAEQSLGLPREPNTDRNTPWKDLPRS